MKTALTVPSPRRTRQRTKRKKLDAICENIYAQNHANSKCDSSHNEHDEETAFEPERSIDLRRSSRIRRAPAVLDLSPAPVKRRKRIETPWEGSKGNEYKRKLRFSDVQVESEDSEDLNTLGNWQSRLRSSSLLSSGKKIGKTKRFQDIIARENDDCFRLNSFEHEAEGWSDEKEFDHHNVSEVHVHNDSIALPDNESAEFKEFDEEADGKETVNEQTSSQDVAQTENANENDVELEPLDDAELEPNDIAEREPNEDVEHGPNANRQDVGARKSAILDEINKEEAEHFKIDGDEDTNKIKTQKPIDKVLQSDVPMLQGRKCGLCGCGNDGKPPKRLIVDATGSESDGYIGSSASEEINYDIWDGFGDEPEWLGRLLGPINDRFGIAGVWVHQHCAVWSPEVYFADLGRLKSVRAALCRGRALKCTRCGRPGATIGCRVDRCPKTYHLPCARLNGCIFNHKKFLIACTDHKHLFQPHGPQLIKRIKMLKAKKMKLDQRKKWHDAWRKDFEAEEKWMENCGEDEEFLKRENRRLQRDLHRLAPIFVGGSESATKNVYDGWESVAGLKDVIQSLKEVVIIPLLYSHFFTSIGSTPPRGVLLHGHPGTGKTHVVRALIGSCARIGHRIAYFARKGADCLGKYVGDAERQLRLLFQLAEKNQPSIIFFDEIDGLAPCRTRQQDQTHSSVVSTLLALMDGLKSRGSVIVIGATNRPEAIDPALRRPGRFDREIFFPLPSMEDRGSILSLHTQKWPRPVNGAMLNWVAQNTIGFSGADLQALCTQAAIFALKRNFALHDVLSRAEKSEGKLPNLPQFYVEERDWIEALVSSPPSSRRVDGIAVNGVVSNPLPLHLLPYFLHPLVNLLVFWYREERIWVPDSLLRGGEAVEKQAVLFLQRRSLPFNTWWLHIDDLLKDPEAVEELQRELSSVGLVTGKDSYESNSPSSPRVSCKGLGFRILIDGDRRSGQKHLASSILHCFVGHITVHKIDLASITHAGHGDLVHGISHLLSKCSCLKTCLIFMPRVDLWGIDCSTDSDTYNIVSQSWLSFMEQMESICVSTSLMILATSNVSLQALPEEVRQFFNCHKPSTSTSSICPCSVPRLTLHLPSQVSVGTCVDHSTELMRNLIKSYIEVMHRGTPASHSHESVTESEAAQPSKDEASKKPDSDTSFSNIKRKPSFLLAMSAFGYQILRSPQFAELCWYTSKLRVGPFAEVKSLDDWPFNSCIIRPMIDPSKVEENSGLKKDKYGIVRGLVAVCLLACKGEYNSLKETSLEVSKALSLLVQDINHRIEMGKDRFSFIRLLSQAAYLDDMVKNWAYSLQSVDADVPFQVTTGHSLAENNHETALHSNPTGASTKGVRGETTTTCRFMEGASKGPYEENDLQSGEEQSSEIDERNSSSAVCVYTCCAGCVAVVYDRLERVVKSELAERNDRSAEEMHDIVASLSVKLINGVLCGGTERNSFCCEKDGVFEAGKCCGHSTENLRLLKEVSFAFRDGVYVPYNVVDFDTSRCNYVSMCLCQLSRILVLHNTSID